MRFGAGCDLRRAVALWREQGPVAARSSAPTPGGGKRNIARPRAMVCHAAVLRESLRFKRALLSRRSYAATLPPDRFYCLLDELPFHLIPQRAVRSLRLQENRDQSFYLNRECILCTAGQVPDELASRKAQFSGFALQGTMAWVRNPATGNLLPFWLGPQLED